MFKQITTLFRGRIYEANQAIVDQNALPILRQQIRDCAHAVETSRRAVAVAMAQNEQEKRQHCQLLKQIADLETRTLSALEQGRDALAQEAAETIAYLEAERDTSEKAQERFQTEISRLRATLRSAETRLRQLQRGQRLAAATDKTQRLQVAVPDTGLSSLREAEDTLHRLQSRQGEIDATAQAMHELEASGSAETIRDKMAAAGCGAPLKSSAESVLDRLRKQQAGPSKA